MQSANVFHFVRSVHKAKDILWRVALCHRVSEWHISRVPEEKEAEVMRGGITSSQKSPAPSEKNWQAGPNEAMFRYGILAACSGQSSDPRSVDGHGLAVVREVAATGIYRARRA